MVDEKPPNPVGDQRGKPKKQSGEKPPNPMGDWGGKPEDWWRYTAHW